MRSNQRNFAGSLLATVLIVSLSALPATAASKAAGKPGGGKTAAAAPAPKGVQMARSATLDGSVNVNPKILEECQIQTALPAAVAARNSTITITDSPSGTVLQLKIVDVHAPNGGVFSGPKSITVDGRLVAGKTTKGTFTARQTSMGSAGNCGMLQKVILAMAADIAAWVDHPTMAAKLGRVR